MNASPDRVKGDGELRKRTSKKGKRNQKEAELGQREGSAARDGCESQQVL